MRVSVSYLNFDSQNSKQRRAVQSAFGLVLRSRRTTQRSRRKGSSSFYITVSSRSFNSQNFKSRVSNPRIIAYLHFNVPSESSSLPGAGPILPGWTSESWTHNYRSRPLPTDRREEAEAGFPTALRPYGLGSTTCWFANMIADCYFKVEINNKQSSHLILFLRYLIQR